MGVQIRRYTPYKLSARQIKWEGRDYQAAGGKISFYMYIHILESVGRLCSVFHTWLQTNNFLPVLEYFDKYMFPYQLLTNRCFHTCNFLSPQEGRKFQHSLLGNTESYRNRSFSFNPNTGCLTPSMKVRWAMQLKLQIMLFYCCLNHSYRWSGQ